jgi:hypothetical protein
VREKLYSRIANTNIDEENRRRWKKKTPEIFFEVYEMDGGGDPNTPKTELRRNIHEKKKSEKFSI